MGQKQKRNNHRGDEPSLHPRPQGSHEDGSIVEFPINLVTHRIHLKEVVKQSNPQNGCNDKGYSESLGEDLSQILFHDNTLFLQPPSDQNPFLETSFTSAI
jgi:hypothetical protein